MMKSSAPTFMYFLKREISLPTTPFVVPEGWLELCSPDLDELTVDGA